jgi:hypothetical protein
MHGSIVSSFDCTLGVCASRRSPELVISLTKLRFRAVSSTAGGPIVGLLAGCQLPEPRAFLMVRETRHIAHDGHQLFGYDGCGIL